MQLAFIVSTIFTALIFSLLFLVPGFKGSRVAFAVTSIWFAFIHAGIASLVYFSTNASLFWMLMGAGAQARTINIGAYYAICVAILFTLTLAQLAVFLGVLKAFQLLKTLPLWSIGLAAVLITACDGGLVANTSLENASAKIWHARVGYLNKQGLLSIPANYVIAGDFINGLALVINPAQAAIADDEVTFTTEKSRTLRKCDFIDKSGKVILKDVLTTASGFSEELIPFFDEKQKLFGYIDTAGKRVIQPLFEKANDFHGGLAIVKIPKLQYEWACIDKSGKVLWTVENAIEITALESDTIGSGESAKPGEAARMTNHADDQHPYYVDNKGKKLEGKDLLRLNRAFFEAPPDGAIETQAIINPIDVGSRFSILPPFEGYSLARVKTNSTDVQQQAGRNQFGGAEYSDDWSFLTLDGRHLFGKYAYIDARPFKDERAAVKIRTATGDRWAYIDKAGKWLTKPEFTSASSFSEGLALVSKEPSNAQNLKTNNFTKSLFGYIDPSGKLVFEERYVYAHSFSEGLAVVQFE